MGTDGSNSFGLVGDNSTDTTKSEQVRVCPVCETANSINELAGRSYQCRKCNLELAYLDYASNGAIRGVLGWLLTPGTVVLDRYRIHSILGKGGFGAAYLVDDLQLNYRRRALKEVPEVLFDEYETSLLSRLYHPAIPDIIERRAMNGMVYQVLKFGGSSTLGSERRKYPDQRIPQDKLLPWMRQLCEVLIYLHGQTPPIIHRDLKPDNILLNEEERIMLVDFGIAKEAKPEAMTRTLGRAATLGFSPPEQIMGTGTDERADIYALGATFYALLTGRNPPAAHERVSGKELLPPSEFVPNIDPVLQDAIIQSLSLNMNQRQQSVMDFAAALGDVESGDAFHPTTNEAQRTVTAERVISSRPQSQPPGLKLPAGRSTSGVRPPATDFVSKAETKQTNILLPLAGFSIFLMAVSIGGYYYVSRPQSKPETALADGDQKSQITSTKPTRVEPPSNQTPNTQTLPIQTTPAQQPEKNQAKVSEAPHPATSNSAQETLKERNSVVNTPPDQQIPMHTEPNMPIVRPEQPPPEPKDAIAWRLIHNSKDPTIFRNFINEFPDSRYVKEARKKINQLNAIASIPAPTISRDRDSGANETSYSREQINSLVRIHKVTSSPRIVGPGGTVTLFMDYSLSLPQNMPSTFVAESWTLKKDGRVLAELPPQKNQRTSGGWQSDANIPVPMNAPAGTYVVVHKVQAGDSSDSRESTFVVSR